MINRISTIWSISVVAVLVIVLAVTNITTQQIPELESSGSGKEINSLAIESGCLDRASYPGAGWPQISNISIEILKSRKWVRNIYDAQRSPAKSITEEFKDNFKAKTVVFYENNASCVFNSTVRISGDWKDHLETSLNYPQASMDVKLEEGNIQGIVRFKLLLPDTRGGESELIAAQIFQETGFVAPRTQLVRVAVNGVQSQRIFQEVASKELLETNFVRETAMYEVNESLLWDSWSKGETNIDGPVTFSKLTNPKWAELGKNHLLISEQGSKILSNAINSIEGITLSPKYLGNGSGYVTSLNEQFQSLSEAMGAGHGLIWHNRKFYFEPVTNGLVPIYYDGNTKLLDPIWQKNKLVDAYSRLNHKLPLVSLESLKSIEKKVNSIEPAILADNLRNSGATVSETDVRIILNRISQNLAELSFISGKFFPDDKRMSLHEDKKDSSSPSPEILIFFGDSLKGWNKCDTTFLECQQFELTSLQVANLLSGNLEIEGKKAFYVGPSKEKFTSGKIAYIEAPVEREQFSIGDQGSILELIGQGSVSINEVSKVVHIELFQPESRALIRGGTLSEWVVEVNSLYQPKFSENQSERFNALLLTGCLTLWDVEVDRVSLAETSGNCEDGINFVRVQGNITSVNISESLQDGLDTDFSNIQMSNVQISDSGNDCVDLSTGSYEIKNLELRNCSDKGLSVGERSKVFVQNVNVNLASIGIASKDSAYLNIGNANIFNSDTCIAIYRKKQEYEGASIGTKKVNCPANKFIIQEKSVWVKE